MSLCGGTGGLGHWVVWRGAWWRSMAWDEWRRYCPLFPDARKQVQKLRLLLRQRGLGAIRVGTVDDYQGQVGSAGLCQLLVGREGGMERRRGIRMGAAELTSTNYCISADLTAGGANHFHFFCPQPPRVAPTRPPPGQRRSRQRRRRGGGGRRALGLLAQPQAFQRGCHPGQGWAVAWVWVWALRV